MDIIDIMLAKAMTPQGQTDIYVNKANKAAAKAAKAEQDAANAIATVTAAAEDIAEKQEAASALLADAQEALETAQQAQINMLDTEDVDDEIKKLDVSVSFIEGQNANTYQVVTTYPDNTLHTENATKIYKATGNNEDGAMTQKAITEALNTKVDNSTLNSYASKAYVNEVVAANPSTGNGEIIINFNTDDAGRIVVVDENGNLTAGYINEEEMIEALLHSGLYSLKNAVGLDMDYANKTFKRIQSATDLSSGSDFDQYPMYGGRKRCNVADDGTIVAFYGDDTYAEDGTNGQVMVYQPKFYYRRMPLAVENLSKGQVIRHDSIIISAIKQGSFKVAPIFIDENGEELDYVLLSAYEGSIANNKLFSIANAKPTCNKTIAEMEAAAQARGTGWHIINMAAESANQMLEIVEFGSMNGQSSLEAGICNTTDNTNVNCSALTGSTSALGNETGHADASVTEINGTTTSYFVEGKRAISYRGVENPWGNTWNMIGGINIKGDGQSLGGAPYICTNFNYTPGVISSNYESLGFNLPSTYGWISAMAIGDSKYDWVFLPAECAPNANSLLPVGDNLWVTAHTTENKILASGGSYNLQENDGLFYYAADRNVAESARPNYGARLMFIPTKNGIYTANVSKWLAKMGA